MNNPATPSSVHPLRVRELFTRFVPTFTPESKRTSWDTIGNAVFWPIFFGLFLHRWIILGSVATDTDDFKLVYEALRRFWEDQPVYSEDYGTFLPHYLYNPGATLLLSPLAWSDHMTIARLSFVFLNGVAIVIGLGLLTRLFGYSMRSAVFPLSLVAAFWTEAVTSTLSFGNINGLVFLALVLFLWMLLRNASWRAGLLLGFMILIKPVFAVLLFLPLVMWWWRTLAAAAFVPIALNIAAWPLLVAPGDYLHKTVPYLQNTRDYANTSLRGIGVYFDLPVPMTVAFWVFFALLIIAGLLAAFTVRDQDALTWMSVCTALLMLAGCFLSSLGQGYYSLFLAPLFFSVTRAWSPAHSWLVWLGFFLVYFPYDWYTPKIPAWSYWFDWFYVSCGWAVLIISLSISMIAYAWRRQKRV